MPDRMAMIDDIVDAMKKTGVDRTYWMAALSYYDDLTLTQVWEKVKFRGEVTENEL
jgi:hypothetical protein